MTNYINYQVELKPENSALIDKLNSMLLGAGEGTQKVKPAPKPKAEPVAQEESGFSIQDLKNACKVAKSAYGEEFCMTLLKENGVAVKSTLGRSMSAVPVEKYDTIITALSEGPQEKDIPDDDFDDDDDDFGDDEPELDAETVTIAVKAYAKEHGRPETKKVMLDCGIKALADISNATASQKQKLYDAVI